MATRLGGHSKWNGQREYVYCTFLYSQANVAGGHASEADETAPIRRVR